MRAVQLRAEDPDTAIADWLQHGAPFGVALPIPPGGLLPLISETATLSTEQLQQADQFTKNHGSFDELVDDVQPALDELVSLVDQGFARLFQDKESAANWLGTAPVVTPLGNVVKLQADRTKKTD